MSTEESMGVVEAASRNTSFVPLTSRMTRCITINPSIAKFRAKLPHWTFKQSAVITLRSFHDVSDGCPWARVTSLHDNSHEGHQELQRLSQWRCPTTGRTIPERTYMVPTLQWFPVMASDEEQRDRKACSAHRQAVLQRYEWFRKSEQRLMEGCYAKLEREGKRNDALTVGVPTDESPHVYHGCEGSMWTPFVGWPTVKDSRPTGRLLTSLPTGPLLPGREGATAFQAAVERLKSAPSIVSVPASEQTQGQGNQQEQDKAKSETDAQSSLDPMSASNTKSNMGSESTSMSSHDEDRRPVSVNDLRPFYPQGKPVKGFCALVAVLQDSTLHEHLWQDTLRTWWQQVNNQLTSTSTEAEGKAEQEDTDTMAAFQVSRPFEDDVARPLMMILPYEAVNEDRAMKELHAAMGPLVDDLTVYSVEYGSWISLLHPLTEYADNLYADEMDKNIHATRDQARKKAVQQAVVEEDTTPVVHVHKQEEEEEVKEHGEHGLTSSSLNTVEKKNVSPTTHTSDKALLKEYLQELNEIITTNEECIQERKRQLRAQSAAQACVT